MEKKTAMGVLLTLVIIVFIAVYWTTEPARQSSASAKFEHLAMVRGAEHYTKSCAQCHGAGGQGLVGPALRSTRLDSVTLQRVIARGIPGTAMPAWGEENGGPLKAHQIQDLVAFIENWDDSLLSASSTRPEPTPARLTAAPTPISPSIAPTVVPTTPPEPTPVPITAAPTPISPSIAPTVVPTTPPEPTPVPVTVAPSPISPSIAPTVVPTTPPAVAGGRLLFTNLGCAACHGIAGEGSPVAPALVRRFDTYVELSTGERVIADDSYLKESINAPEAKVVKGYQPGLMPKYSISGSQLEQLVEFIRSLK